MRVGGADLQVRVAVEFDEFDRRTQQRGGSFRASPNALRGRAVSAGFAARADDEVRRAAGAGFARDHAAAAEFDVVGMRAKGQQRRGFRQGFRCRLHRNGQWHRG